MSAAPSASSCPPSRQTSSTSGSPSGGRDNRRASAERLLRACLGASAWLVLLIGCARVSAPAGGSGTGGFNFGVSTGGAGASPGNGSGGDFGTSGTGGKTLMSNTDGGICQEASYTFVPKNPTVYIVVDRSGSMFDCISTSNAEPSCPDPNDTSWTKLKNGVLPVVQTLEKDVRFGFTTICGTNPNPSYKGTCPIMDKVPPALMNYTAISTLYNSLQPGPNSTQPGVKFETPTELILGLVGKELMADTAPGDKYVLFVTDGEPDYCGDGNQLCAPDGVVGQLQTLKAAGITTIVFGIMATSIQTLAPGILQAFANAGAGEPTLAPLRGTNPSINDFYDQCFNTGAPADDAAGGWTRSFMASGKPMMRGQTIGTYATAAGPTKPYQPNITNQADLVNQISAALAGVKSCIFDLNNVNGKALKVNLQLLARARVLIQGTIIPLDDTNGWKMNTESQLELTGAACTQWRQPANTMIDFQFPCEIIVPE
jgi:hypothetical protein